MGRIIFIFHTGWNHFNYMIYAKKKVKVSETFIK